MSTSGSSGSSGGIVGRMLAVLGSSGASGRTTEETAEELLAILEEESDDDMTPEELLLAAFRSGSAGASGSSGQDLAAQFVDLLDGDGTWGVSGGTWGVNGPWGVSGAAQGHRNRFYGSLLNNMRGVSGDRYSRSELPNILLLGLADRELYSAWGASGQLSVVPLDIYSNPGHYLSPNRRYLLRIAGTSGASGLIVARHDSEEYFRATVLPHLNRARAAGLHGLSGDNELLQLFMDALSEDADDGSATQRLARMLLEALAEESAGATGTSGASGASGSSGRGRPTKLNALIAMADARFDMPDSHRREDRDELNEVQEQGWGAVRQRLDATEPPWAEGHRLDINGRGGLYYLERDRVTVAAEVYDSRVFGNLDVDIANDYEMMVDGDVTIGVQAPTGSSGSSGSSGASGTSGSSGSSASAGASGSSGVSGSSGSSSSSSSTSSAGSSTQTPRATSTPAAPVGVERLTVGGTARFEFHERKTMLTGTVNRLWEGPIVRMIGMDGIICGGVFGRIHAGPSFTLAHLASSDVYGGAAHVAAARIHASTLGYRSADATAWAMAAYVRATRVTLEPLLGTPSQTLPFRDAKLAAKLGKLALAACPFLDILMGLALLFPMLLIALIRKVIRARATPPAGPPRLRNRSAGFTKEVAASVLHV